MRIARWPQGLVEACRGLPVVFAVACVWLLLSSASALALTQRGHAFSLSFATQGSGEGQLLRPAGVAVNEATGDVYVVDRGNNRIERFDKEGKFLEVWGWGVKDGEAKYEQCATGQGCKAGIPDAGLYPTKFKRGAGQLISPEGIAVDNSTSAEDPSKGDVYVVADVIPGKSYVEKFSATGAYIGHLTSKADTEALGRADGVAVDQNGLVLVAWNAAAITAYSNAESAKHVGEPIESQVATRPGFAAGPNNDLYVNYEPAERFTEAGEGVLAEEGRGENGEEPCGPAPCFVSKLTGVLSGQELPPGETLVEGLGGGAVRSLAVDFATDELFVANGNSVQNYTAAGTLVQKFGSSQLTTAAGVAVDAGTGDVYVTDASTGKVEVYVPEPPAKPVIEEPSSSSVTTSSVDLSAQVDPTGAEATVTFEYGTSTCSTAPCTQIPAGSVGAGFGAQLARAHVSGLSAATTYFYRVLATNQFGTSVSEERSFITQPATAPSALPDGRAWELVSPADKNGAGFEAITKEGGVIAAAEDGTRVTYLSTSPDEPGPEGNRPPTFLQNLGTRQLNASGTPEWTHKDIAIPNEAPRGVIPGHEQEYLSFSSDLTSALVQPFGRTANAEPPLSPEATEKTIYVRHNEGCSPPPSTCYTPLVTSTSDTAGTKFGGNPALSNAGVRFIAGSPDLQHVVLSSEVPLTTEPAATGKNLYEWTAGLPASEQLRVINLKPGNAEAAVGAEIGQNSLLVRHAISKDGRRVFWEESGTGHLFMRDTVKHETIRIDVPEAGAEVGPNERARFQTASEDGSKIFFTDEQRLTVGSTASREAGQPDLYECEVLEEPGTGKPSCKLRDLTIDTTSGESANVRGLVLEASTDGSTVYFVANGVLTSLANPGGETAKPGQCVESLAPPEATCNLYMEHYNSESGHEGWERPSLVAVLSNEDEPVWANNNHNLGLTTSRVSPSGEHLAFMSSRSLTGYDNRDANPAAGGARDEEVFLYNKSSGGLVCASCNPTGARPVGVFDTEESGEGLGLLVDRVAAWEGHWLAGSIPGWTDAEGNRALYQSRYLSDKGRLYFNSADSLVPKDTNGKEDVYQYEPSGEGDCKSANGCVALISSGTASKESAFLDASTSGNDVFFLTSAPLVPQDKDTSFDVYDARVCEAGSPCVPAGSVPQPPCATPEACKGAAQALPSFNTPASSAISAASAPVVPASKVLPAKVVKLTRKQLLARALKACKRLKTKKKRSACEASARRRYRAKRASTRTSASARRAPGGGR